MNRTAKALLIPVAAFAVTMSGGAAFSRSVLARAGLNEDQISAFENADTLRRRGDLAAARDTLVGAGIDESAMRAVSNAIQAHKQQQSNPIQQAVTNNDYAAFQQAIEGSPLADIITSQDEFERFVAAADLKEAGNVNAADEIMHDLGMTSTAYASLSNGTPA